MDNKKFIILVIVILLLILSYIGYKNTFQDQNGKSLNPFEEHPLESSSEKKDSSFNLMELKEQKDKN